MMINKITSTVDYNVWLKRLGTELNEPTNLNFHKIPKVVKPTNNKTLLKYFWDYVISRPLSSSFLISIFYKNNKITHL